MPKCKGGASSNGPKVKKGGVPQANAGARIPNTQTSKGGAQKGPTRGKRSWGDTKVPFNVPNLPGHRPW